MAWFKRKDKKLKFSEKKDIPDGLWDKCPDDVIKSFIMRASQVNYHELVVLPNKVNNVS